MTPAVNQLANILSELANLPQLANRANLEAQALKDLLAAPRTTLEALPRLVTDEMVDAFNSPDTPEHMPYREALRLRIASALSVVSMAPNQVLPEEWYIRVTAKDDVFLLQIISPSVDDPKEVPALPKDIPGVLTVGIPRDGSSPAAIAAGLHDAIEHQNKLR